MVSLKSVASSEELWSKVDGFHSGENPSPIAGMKDSLKKSVSAKRKNFWFVLAGISVSTTCWKISFHYTEKLLLLAKKSTIIFFCSNIFLFKYFPAAFNHGFQQQEKGSKQKNTVSTRHKLSFY